MIDKEVYKEVTKEINKEAILKDFSNNMEVNELLKKYKISLYKFRLLVPLKKRVIDKKAILKDYLNNVKIVDILKKYNIGTTILYSLISKKRTKKNLNKFKNLENKELQYWLGFICAKSGVTNKQSQYSYNLKLCSKDKSKLKGFKAFFGEMVKLYYAQTTNSWNVVIYCKELVAYFKEELNIIPLQHKILNPNIEITSNFLLGFFDGRGCVGDHLTLTRRHLGAKFTVGSETFLEKISKLLFKNGVKTEKQEKESYFDLCVSEGLQTKNLYHFLYQDYITCHKGNLDKFVALYGNIEK